MEQTLAAKEHLAEEIIINKQAIVDFDRKKNSNKEALDQLERTQDKKIWAFSSDMFIKLPTNQTKAWIEKEQKLLNEKMDTARNIIKQNTNVLHQMEGKKELHGFNLNGMTVTDLYHNTNK